MSEKQNGEWGRYGGAMIEAMLEVLEEADDSHRELLLETADYWLGVGITIGLRRPDQAHTLLGVIHGGDDEGGELLSDADELLSMAL